MTYDTYVTKLTLSVNEDVVERAKRYAATRGTSVSRLVESYLDALSRLRAAKHEELPPVTRRLRVLLGSLKGASYDRKEHIDHLERKYR